MPNLERLLLAVDDSANGKFAAQLAGLIAGPRGMPTTVLPLAETGKNNAKGRGKKAEQKDAEEHERAGSRQGGRRRKQARQMSEDEPGPVDVTVRRLDAQRRGRHKEAKKGYDLLFMGVANNANNGAIPPGRLAHRLGVRRAAGDHRR